MGDRFYQQQYGTTMGALAEPKRRAVTSSGAKETKASMAATIGITGIDKLLVADLRKLMLLDDFPKLTMPTGRLKKPYIDECLKIHQDVDWSKLTVAILKNVINSC